MSSRCCHRLEHEDVFSTPKFFKIITDPISFNLRIPAAFMKRHGENLRNRIFLKVPNTSNLWEVELVHSNTQTLLQKGWKEFSDRYSLGFGHFLVFEYNGDSQFDVLIFDTTASEINYPTIIFDTTASEINYPDAFTDTVQKKQKVVARETSVTYQKALDFAAGLTCRSPFFIFLMQPSYINTARYGLNIPMSFAKGNLPRKLSTRATLGINKDEKKVWPIKLYCNERRAKISFGWKTFVNDNGLKVGDACLFEMVNHFHWNVIIFKS